MKLSAWIAVAVVALSAAPALAADLPARVSSKAPAGVAPTYNWGGFYIGLNGGGGSSHKCWDLKTVVGVGPIGVAPEGCHLAFGGLAGGQIKECFKCKKVWKCSSRYGLRSLWKI